jgi:hypothetical protein
MTRPKAIGPINKFPFIGLSLLLLALSLGATVFRTPILRAVVATLQTIKGKRTVADRVHEFGPPVRARLAHDFARIGLSYPPTRITLVGLKAEKRLEVWVRGERPPWHLLRTYPILAASGQLGPKLREGDNQVPEGLYAIESLNPNSLYHLALRVGYPNAFDRMMGERDGRKNLGGDIMIHGNACSVGCLAMGDPASEELFVLAAETGIAHISVILAPVDLRTIELPTNMPAVPVWTPELYAELRRALLALTEGG